MTTISEPAHKLTEAELDEAFAISRRFEPLLAGLRAAGVPAQRVCLALVMVACREAMQDPKQYQDQIRELMNKVTAELGRIVPAQ